MPAGAPNGIVPKAGDLIEFRLVSAGGPGLVVLGEGADVGAASIFVSPNSSISPSSAATNSLPALRR